MQQKNWMPLQTTKKSHRMVQWYGSKVQLVELSDLKDHLSDLLVQSRSLKDPKMKQLGDLKVQQTKLSSD